MPGDLDQFLPEAATGYIHDWFRQHDVMLRITRSRTSKYGDYRAAGKGNLPRITVNHNLGPYEFLVTLVHEMAHHEVFLRQAEPAGFGFFIKRKARPRPHGKEWKQKYRELMEPLLNLSVFPPEILDPLIDHLRNPGASAGTSPHLSKVLQAYCEPDGSEFIGDLPENALFRISGGRIFMKKEKVRTRYRCISQDNKRIYLFSPAARVMRLEPEKPYQCKLEF